MTIELFRNDSYLKDHDTIISEIVPEGLVLNETIFYPEGGGQPGDEGSITINNQTINVIGTRYIDNKLVHLIENGTLSADERKHSNLGVHLC